MHSPPSTPKSQLKGVHSAHSHAKINGQSPSPTKRSSSKAMSSSTPRQSPLVYAPMPVLGPPLSLDTQAASPAALSKHSPATSEGVHQEEGLDQQRVSETISASPGWLERMGLSSPNKLRGRVRSLASQRSISRPNLVESTLLREASD